MSSGPRERLLHNTNTSQIWSSWGKDATTLVGGLNALWDGHHKSSQNSIIEATRLVLLDTTAAIVNGLAEATIQAYAQNNATLEQGYLHFPGVKQALSVHGLISVLSAAAPWNELVEGHAKSHGRPALHVVPLCISLGLSREASLDRILRAVMEGYEIGARLGEAYAVPPGEHVDGTWGTVGATVSACRLLGNSPEQTQGAINAALCQMTRSLFAPVEAGAESRLLFSGLSANNGLQLAVGARAGLHGPAELRRPSADHQQRWPIAPDFTIRSSFAIDNSYVKLYPGARHLHYCMEAALNWRESQGFNPAEHLNEQDLPKTIIITTYPEAARYCDKAQPSNRIQAQFSLQYATCICLLTGSTGPDIFKRNHLTQPDIALLLDRTKLQTDNHRYGRWASLTITDRQGKISHAESTTLKGDPCNPLTTADRIKKAQQLMESHLGTDITEQLINHWLKGNLREKLIPDGISDIPNQKD
jgi:2-methylcitrate dehydratase PrpD